MTARSRSQLWRRVLRTTGSRMLHWAENNGNSTLERNGELWLLRRVLRAHAARDRDRRFVVFDAGANRGLYTKVVLSEAARAGCKTTVHAFEPSPACAEFLRSSFAHEPNVCVVSAALSNVDGDAALFAGSSGSSQASLMPREAHGGAGDQGSVRVPLLRLSEYLETSAVERVDLLKLDIEGSELSALRGLGSRLSPQVVPLIQFEYGGTTLDAGVRLGDLFELLTAAGYSLAKLFPRALELRRYAPWMEHYAYANYIAVSPEWLERL